VSIIQSQWYEPTGCEKKLYACTSEHLRKVASTCRQQATIYMNDPRQVSCVMCVPAKRGLSEIDCNLCAWVLLTGRECRVSSRHITALGLREERAAQLVRWARFIEEHIERRECKESE
jgi:hypothetical protein